MKGRKFLAMLCAFMLLVMNFSSCVPGLAEAIEAAAEAPEVTETVEPDGEQVTEEPTEAPTEAPSDDEETPPDNTEGDGETSDPDSDNTDGDSEGSDDPTEAPTEAPTEQPSEDEESEPTEAPSGDPDEDKSTPQPEQTEVDSVTPEPTEVDSVTPEPTDAPTEEPTETPTEEPTEAPTEEPTEAPTEEPTEAPTEEPTEAPTEEPTEAPTEEPTEAPTEEPTEEPTPEPTEEPTPEPTEEPVFELADFAADAVTVFPGDTIHFTFNATGADRVEYRIYNEAGDFATGEAESAFEWTAGEAGDYIAAITAFAGDRTLYAELAITVRADYSGVAVTYTAYDSADEPAIILGCVDKPLDKAAYDLKSAGPVAFDGYDYIETRLGDTKLDALAYSEADRAWMYTAGDVTAPLTEDAALVVRFEQQFTRRFYEYDDRNIHAKVWVRRASDVPDDAEFVVRQVTESTRGYNYDAYMDALNAQPTEQEYTAENTLLYDFAFMVYEKDELGMPTNKQVEFQPEAGSIRIQVTFKRNQISDKLGAEEAEAVEVIHLPLDADVRDAVDSTAQATDISADDINIDARNATVNLDGNTDKVEFKVDTLSVIAVVNIADSAAFDENGDTGYTIKLFDVSGATPVQITDTTNLTNTGNIYLRGSFTVVEGDQYYSSKQVYEKYWSLSELATDSSINVILSEFKKNSSTAYSGTLSDTDITFELVAGNYWDAPSVAAGTFIGKYNFDSISKDDDAKTVSVNLKSLPEGTSNPHAVTIDFYDNSQTTKVNPNLDDTAYYIVGTLSEKGVQDGPVLAYAIQKLEDTNITEISTNGTTTVTFATGTQFQVIDASGNAVGGVTINYDPSLYKLSTRLRHGGSLPNTYNDAKQASDTIDGFDFLSNVMADNGLTSTITLHEAYSKDYRVHLDYDPNGGAPDAGARLYLQVVVEHATTGTDYYLKPIVDDTSDYYIFQDNTFVDNGWLFTNTKNEDKSVIGTNETVTVRVLKANPGTTLTTANPSASEYEVIGEGELFFDSTLSYQRKDGQKRVDEDIAQGKTVITDYVNLTKISLDSALTPSGVLGSGVEFGITANKLEQRNDLQTNFAVREYDTEHDFKPDLSGAGNRPGKVIASTITGTPKVSNPGSQVVFYTSEELSIFDGYDANTGKLNGAHSYLTVVREDATTLNEMVGDIIDPAMAMSRTLSQKTKTFKPTVPAASNANRMYIDVRGLGSGTIYIDADDIPSKFFTTTNGLQIEKLDSQVIVFNFSGDADVNQFTVNGVPSEGSTRPGEKNNTLESTIAKKFVFNVPNGNAKLTEVAGMVLVNGNVTLGNTSSGWVICSGTFDNKTQGEWHNIFTGITEVPDVEDFTLEAWKLIDNENADHSFKFKLEHWDTIGTDAPHWSTVSGTNGVLNVADGDNKGSIKFENLDGLNIGWNIYRITEEGFTDNNDADKYFKDEAVFYAAVYLTASTHAVSTPKYFKSFDETTAFSRTDTDVPSVLTDEISSSDKPTFKNYKKGKLELKKTVSGANADATKKFTFTITLVLPTYVVADLGEATSVTYSGVTFKKNDEGKWVGKVTLSQNDGAKTIELPATTTYTVVEKAEAGYTQMVGESNGDTTTGTIESEQTKRAYYTNIRTNDLLGSAVIKVKKTVTATSGSTYSGDEDFEFTLQRYADDNGAPLPDDCTVSIKNGETGSFGEITYSLSPDEAATAVTYTYKIHETVGTTTGMEYADNDQIVRVVVVRNDAVTALDVSVYYDGITENANTTAADENAAAEVKNVYSAPQLGSLTITKSWGGAAVSALTDAEKKSASFTVTGPDNYSETFTYEDIGTTGKVLSGLTLGKYTVTETVPTKDGYTITATYMVDSDETNEVTLGTGNTEATVAVTNTVTRDTGSLKIKKSVTLNGTETTSADLNGVYSFTIAGKADTLTAGENKTVTITISGGSATAATGGTLGSDGWVTVSGLPTGTYTITENLTQAQTSAGIALTGNNGVEVTVLKDGDDVTVPTCEFTNNKDTGKIKVTKAALVNGLADAAAAGKTITVGLFASADADTALETKVITLNDNGTGEVEFTGLRAGIKYYVYEMDGATKKTGGNTITVDSLEYTVGAYTAEATAAEGNSAPTVAITNTRTETGKLTVTKTVKVDGTQVDPADSNADSRITGHVFKVTIHDDTDNKYLTAYDATTKTPTFGDTQTKFNVTIGTPLVIEGLPTGHSFTVRESSDSDDVTIAGYTYTYSDTNNTTSGTVTVNNTTAGVTVALENNYQEVTSIRVEKKWQCADGTDMETWPDGVSVTVYLTKQASDGTYTDVPGKTLTLRAGTPSDSFTDLPVKDGSNAIIYGVREGTVQNYTGTVTGDASTGFTITNKHDTGSISKSFQVTKALKYGDADYDTWPQAGFTFELAKANFEPTDGASFTGPVTENATSRSKTATFNPITFTKPGTYTFTITEKLPAGATTSPVNGITYDTTAHNVTVTVGYGDNHNDLVATVKYDTDKDTLTVTNTYAVTPTTAQVQVTKQLVNKGTTTQADAGNWPTDGFTFNLAKANFEPTDGASFTDPVTAKAASSSSSTAMFGAITFTKPGTYTFTLTEAAGNDPHISYWNGQVTVTVTVEDKHDGTLEASVKYGTADSYTVTNEYSETQNYYTYDTAVLRKVNGSSFLPGAQFQLGTKDSSDNWTGINDAVYTSDSNDATKGQFTIDTSADVLRPYLPTTENGTMTLYLKEIKAPDGYVLDETLHTVVITLKKLYTSTVIDVNWKYEITVDGLARTTAQPLDISNTITSVKVSKVDVTGNTELAGAHIQILYTENGVEKVFTEWDSSDSDKQHEVTGLVTGVEYTLRETVAPTGYHLTTDTTFKLDANGTVVTTGTTAPADTKDDNGETILLVKDTAVAKPSFDKKIKDKNDTAGTTSEWQDVADHDIGDAVPFRLHATLPTDVTSYYQYHITFDDEMDASLDFNANSIAVTVKKGNTVLDSTGYTLTKTTDTHAFTLTLTWKGGTGTDGKPTKITNTDLNGAEVFVEFTATLNSNAKLGSDGNVNRARLKYSNTPSLDQNGNIRDGSDNEGITDWDYVIVFTYTVEVDKVDQDGGALTGATFTLEKKLADGSTTVIETVEAQPTTKFTFKGLDDGTYQLTETVAPDGYLPIDPITFTIAAGHLTEWNGDADKKPTVYNENGVKITSANLTFTKQGSGSYKTDVENKQTSVKVSKVDATTYEELSGARIQILSSDGTVVEKWTSGTTPHEVKGLNIGEEYTLRETVAPNGYDITSDTTFTINADGTVNTTGSKTDDGVLLVEDTLLDTPEFDKKIQDANDTTGETSGWQDAADHDIGDAVPYRLHAKLPTDVSSFVKYHITFHDTMDASLDFNASSVKIEVVKGGKAVGTAYAKALDSDKHGFDLTLTWEAEKNGGKYTGKLPTDLNGADVYVYFTATLNEKANLGSKGNVNTAYLEYSDNPSVTQDGQGNDQPNEHTDETEEDSVIVFTYTVEVDKVDQDGEALKGATFKLEKLGANGKPLADQAKYVTGGSGSVFTFTGLDDGTYQLTETVVPDGYLPIDPITFTVKAGHKIDWDGKDATKPNVYADPQFSGGSLKFTAITGGAKANVVNEKYTAEGSLTFEGTKSIEGRSLTSGDIFEFEIILEGGGSWNQKVWTVKNDATGKIAFPTFTYSLDEAGRTYTYKVREQSPSTDKITKDETRYEIKVQIVDNGDGTLTAKVLSGNPKKLNFVNKPVEDKTPAPTTPAPTTPAPTTPAPTTAAPTTAAPTTAAPTTAAPTTAAPTTAAPTTAAPTTAAPTTAAPTATATATPGPNNDTTPKPAPAPTELVGKKVWLDENNKFGTRPDSITVELYANGVLVPDAKPTWKDTKTNAWTYTFSKLPTVDEAGKSITYTVREVPVENYESSVNGTTITNKLIPSEIEEFTNLTGLKTWNDADNASGKRPESITVHLLRDGVVVETLTVTAADNWRYTFENQPVDNGYGHVYTYTVREDAVPGYYCRTNGLDLTNNLLEIENEEGKKTPNNDEDNVPNRNTKTERPKFEQFDVGELEDLMVMLDYGTPLWGQLLGTGDETPAYPFVFGGIGVLALAVLLITRKKRRIA